MIVPLFRRLRIIRCLVLVGIGLLLGEDREIV